MASEVFTVFGLKIIATRQGFPDDALESRAFVITMRTSADKKKNLPPEAFEQAQFLRNKLLAFRFDNLDSFANDYDLEFPDVNPRLNQILQPMASLAKSKIPSFYQEIESIAQKLAEALVEERAKSLDGLIVRAYFLLASKGPGGTTAREIAETMTANFDVEIKPERVGKRIGPLGFQRSRGRARLSELPREMWADMARKYLLKDERAEVLPKLGVEPTNAEIAESLGLAPDPTPAIPETAPDGIPFLRHVPGNEMHPKLTGAKNLMAISDRIKMKLKWSPREPDSWIARDTLLALQLPEDSQPELEAFVASMRKGMDP